MGLYHPGWLDDGGSYSEYSSACDEGFVSGYLKGYKAAQNGEPNKYQHVLDRKLEREERRLKFLQEEAERRAKQEAAWKKVVLEHGCREATNNLGAACHAVLEESKNQCQPIPVT